MVCLRCNPLFNIFFDGENNIGLLNPDTCINEVGKHEPASYPNLRSKLATVAFLRGVGTGGKLSYPFLKSKLSIRSFHFQGVG